MAAADPLRPLPVPVRAVRRELEDVFTLDLDVSAIPGGIAFSPGQFMMLYAFGVGEAPISISGDPYDGQTLVHTIRAVGGVTRALWELQPGDVVGLRGPYGSAWPLEAARGRDLVIVAGGIGLAPLRPVICHLLRQRGDYGRVEICYGARSPGDILYEAELRRWREAGGMEVRVTVDHGGRGWRGDVGVVTDLLARVRCNPANTLAFVCGPEVMMRFTLRSLQDLGIAGDAIHLSMERNMHCAVGFCGHCQLGPLFICKDGPVFPWPRIAPFFGIREL